MKQMKSRKMRKINVDVDLSHYKFHRTSLNRGGSFMVKKWLDPKWLKNKKATINSKNNYDKCFQFAITVALNHE